MSTSMTMTQLLEAGAHFGHQTRFWCPKMAPYIFGSRNKIHIINLEHTLPMFIKAQDYVRRLASNKGTILFVGTKRQARSIIREEAIRAGMPFVDQRWLGGTLTNFKTIRQSIKRLEEKTALLDSVVGYSKKEQLMLQREVNKLERSLGGIKDMKGLPDAVFVIDIGYQKGAVIEAMKLGIPVIGVVDTNFSPDGIDYIIPGNDDSSRAISLYARGMADAILEGRLQSLQDIVASIPQPTPPKKVVVENKKVVAKTKKILPKEETTPASEEKAIPEAAQASVISDVVIVELLPEEAVSDPAQLATEVTAAS